MRKGSVTEELERLVNRAKFEDPILVRAGRRLVPTMRALEIREKVAKLVEGAHDLVRPDGLDAWMRSCREFLVRAPDGIAIVHGPALLAALRTRLPAATLRFLPESDADPAALREGRIGLDLGSVVDTSVETLAASRSELVACVPAPLARNVASALGLQLFKLPMDVPAEKVVQAWHPRMDSYPAHRWLRACVDAVSKLGDLGRTTRRARHQSLIGPIDSSV